MGSKPQANRGISMPQIKALKLALAEGNVFGGYNHSKGARHNVSFWTLVACADRGWLQMLSPTGGQSYFVITDAGRALRCLYPEGQAPEVAPKDDGIKTGGTR